jgi:hypothetical protein
MRLHHLSPGDKPRPQEPAITAAVFAEFVLQMSIILSSVTCAGSFFKTYHSQQIFGAPESSNRTRRLGYLKRDNNTATDLFQMMSRGTDKLSPLPLASDDDTAPLRSPPLQTIRTELPLPCRASADEVISADHQRQKISGS